MIEELEVLLSRTFSKSAIISVNMMYAEGSRGNLLIIL